MFQYLVDFIQGAKSFHVITTISSAGKTGTSVREFYLLGVILLTIWLFEISGVSLLNLLEGLISLKAMEFHKSFMQSLATSQLVKRNNLNTYLFLHIFSPVVKSVESGKNLLECIRPHS